MTEYFLHVSVHIKIQSSLTVMTSTRKIYIYSNTIAYTSYLIICSNNDEVSTGRYKYQMYTRIYKMTESLVDEHQYNIHLNVYASLFLVQDIKVGLVWFMVFNATFNDISVISWQSVLLVEETGVPRENHRPA